MAEPELGLPFCGMSSQAISEAVAGANKWNHEPVTIAHNMNLPAANISNSLITTLFQEVASLWSGVCGLDLRVIEGGQANIFAIVDNMDGPNGILGESYLPYPGITPQAVLAQRYDRGELWTRSFLKRVILHEVGHALGLPHAIPPDAASGTQSVMNPYLTAFEVPQAWEIDQLQRRYGPPSPVAPPTPTPTPPTQPPTPAGNEEIIDRPVPVPGSIALSVATPGSYLIQVRKATLRDRVRLTVVRRS